MDSDDNQRAVPRESLEEGNPLHFQALLLQK
jgi:hypothetical protein